MPFIYKITDDVNNKVYIGKTSFSIEKRWHEHLQDYKRDLKLSDRVFRCNECGTELDRDYNAAINLMRYETH